jgi:hypothetical protein
MAVTVDVNRFGQRLESKGLTNKTAVVFFKKSNLTGGHHHEYKCSGGG